MKDRQRHRLAAAMALKWYSVLVTVSLMEGVLLIALEILMKENNASYYASVKTQRVNVDENHGHLLITLQYHRAYQH